MRAFFRKSSVVRDFVPALVVLIFSLVAIHSTVRLTAEHRNLQDHYERLMAHYLEDTRDAEEHLVEGQEVLALSRRTAEMSQWLYWSVTLMGLLGFVLVVLNADKVKRLEMLNGEKKVSLKLLEERLITILKTDQEKKDMQDQLYQAQKMEAIGRLAGGIAHDFNNILAAMNGYAEFLIEDLEDRPQQKAFSQNILQAGKQAKALVDKILSFSRRSDSGIETLDMRGPLQESLSMLQASLPKTIEVKTDILSGPACIMGNATQISQVVMNLCVNAKDAMQDDRGRLEISLKPSDVRAVFPPDFVMEELPDPREMPPIRIDEVGPNQTRLILGRVVGDMPYYVLKISDTGVGMSRTVMEHVFEPFFTTKPVDKGTGLGLSTVHGVVGGHRGALLLESTIGQGTVFSLYFPAIPDGLSFQDVSGEEGAFKSSGGRILLVEDQAEVRLMTHTMLTRLGYDVLCVENGLEALDLLREKPDEIDLVLTDQNMAKMTGLELVFEAYHDFPDLPFVLLSGYSQEALEEFMARHNSIKAVLHKPVLQKTLGDVLQKILQG